MPIFIIQGDLHQGFGLRRESWSIPNSLIIGQILSFYLIPWSKLISLLVWINKPYPHLVSLLVRVPIIISSRCKTESIDDHLGSSNTWASTGLKICDNGLRVILKRVFRIFIVDCQVFNELLPIQRY